MDINRVAHSAWQAAPLQFVAGLGPRKAQALLRAAGREEGVASRYTMWNELGVMGKCVFRCEPPTLPAGGPSRLAP